MAWISVHEGVDGAKLRNLYKKLRCSKFEAVGILNFLWFWGLSNADKYGLILYVDREEIERYFIGQGAGCKLEPSSIVEALIETGWLDVTPNGMYIHDWEEWQEQWYKAKERRENDAKRKRDSRKKEATEKHHEESPADGPPDAPNDTPNGEAHIEQKYVNAFEEFWAEYPRKIGKGEAYKKYQARKNDGFSDSQLKEAAVNYAKQCIKNKTEKQYIKHPKTFLSDTTPFLDFLPKGILENDIDSQATVQDGSVNPFNEWGDVE